MKDASVADDDSSRLMLDGMIISDDDFKRGGAIVLWKKREIEEVSFFCLMLVDAMDARESSTELE